ncbi:MAG TPA: winged helix-turn-helix domain-containing protein [Ktedonobacterales bacterium]
MAAPEDYSIPDPFDFPPGRFPARIPLGPDCWHEPRSGRVVSQGREILLTPHQNVLLVILLRARPHYRQAGDLGAALAEHFGVEEISGQCVKETIRGLRDKLNQSAAAGMLETRRGYGYRIAPHAQEGTG